MANMFHTAGTCARACLCFIATIPTRGSIVFNTKENALAQRLSRYQMRAALQPTARSATLLWINFIISRSCYDEGCCWLAVSTYTHSCSFAVVRLETNCSWFGLALATGLWLVSYRWEDLSEFAIHARPSGWVPFTILDIAFEMGETCVLPDDVCDWSLEWRRRSNQRDFLRSVINLEFSVRISLRATTFKEGRAVSHPRRNFCRLLLINVNPVNYIYTTIYYTYITSLLPHSRNRRK